MKSVSLVSLGCAKNLVDSENILGLLDHHKYRITNSVIDSDIIIINTCGFIESSKKESIDTIFSMLTYGKPLVVTGCLVERYYEELKKEIPEVALFIPIKDYYRFNELLSTIDSELISKDGLDDDYRIISTLPFSCYLKIGEGCSNCCSYCAIPLIRGSYRSRDLASILKEANKQKEQGIKEITILQQDTTKYGSDLEGDITIVTLLKELLKIKEFEYIRLLYLYPDEISDELIDLISTNQDRLTPYFDIPIQHSETHILKDMNRRGDKRFLLRLFNKIRNKIPNAILRTTIMVGFPGETKKDIDNLKTFMEKVSFDHLGVFTYSKEEDTPSYSFKKQVKESTKKKRLDEVMKLQQKISYKRNKSHIGQYMDGLVVGYDGTHYRLRSYFNAPDDIDGKIFFTSDIRLDLGDKVRVKINEAYVYDLFGSLDKKL